MLKFFRIFFFYFCLFSVYADTFNKSKHYFRNMTCNELMHGLIRENSLNKKFQDKSLGLELYYERQDDRYIGFTYVCRAEVHSDCEYIYANFELDLANQSLMYIDPSPPIPIKINKSYVPFIADKCTPAENLYRRGKLPEPDES